MSEKIVFDLRKYIRLEKEAIEKRIASFDGKLYLEIGGKLFDDFHATRVLPGFKANTKIDLLLELKDQTEVVIVVNAKDINSNKVRNDFGITYSAEVDRLISLFSNVDLSINSVVLSFYDDTPLVKEFIQKMNKRGIKVYKHYELNGYPQNIPLILSKNGLGRNEYIQTTKPLVVVTAPGPGSGKMATCLSQLYHDNLRGIRAGYAKFETFPIWNLPLKHPLNTAYEAATVDLADINMIDPYHLAKYGINAVNYNRDIEVFPLLKNIFDGIYGKSPYESPTDMGVNMLGYAIIDEKETENCCKQEVIRRYYQALKNNYLGRFKDETVDKAILLMQQMGVTTANRKCVKACLQKHEICDQPVVAIQVSKTKIITGKRSNLFGASTAALLNALKYFAKIDDSIPLISKQVIEPIQRLKVNSLHNENPRLHPEEVLVALSIQAYSNPLAQMALDHLKDLKGCEAHSSCILAEVDLNTFKKIGINITEEPVSYIKN